MGDAPVFRPAHGQIREWTLERGVTIGSVDDPVYGLSAVEQVLADAERVFVLQPQDGKVRVFSHAGEFVRDLGGRGRGPGELVRPSSMGRYGSRLWVTEPMSGRVTFFDVATGAAETIRYRADVPGSREEWIPAAVLANGRIVASPRVTMAPGGQGMASETAIIVTDSEGNLLDTLARRSIAGNIGKITAGLPAGTEMYVVSPLPDYDITSFAPDGSGVVLVKRRIWDGGTDPATFEITRIDLHGDTVYRRSIQYQPRRVPSDFFDDEIARSADGSGINNRRDHARALREFYEEGRYFPPVTAMSMGSDGTTWVARVDVDGEREWLVLDDAGSSVGRLRLPTTSHVAYANETECWVVETDALDIPYVVRYDIIR